MLPPLLHKKASINEKKIGQTAVCPIFLRFMISYFFTVFLQGARFALGFAAAGAVLASAADAALVVGAVVSALVSTTGAAFTSAAGAAGSAFALAAFFTAGFSALTGSAAFAVGAADFSSTFLVVRGLRAAGFWAEVASLAGTAVVSAAGAGASSTLAARFTRSFTSEMVHS